MGRFLGFGVVGDVAAAFADVALEVAFLLGEVQWIGVGEERVVAEGVVGLAAFDG